MKKHPAFLTITLLIISFQLCIAQVDSTEKQPSIFEKIAKEMKDFKLDTSALPDDKTTKTIIELRQLRGGFNINEMIEYKIAESKQKKEKSEEELNKISAYFKTGLGKYYLDNAVIWIYRKNFTYKELKEQVKFYKSSAGQKLAESFPLILVKTLATAELLQEQFIKNQKGN